MELGAPETCFTFLVEGQIFSRFFEVKLAFEILRGRHFQLNLAGQPFCFIHISDYHRTEQYEPLDRIEDEWKHIEHVSTLASRWEKDNGRETGHQCCLHFCPKTETQ